MILVVLSTHAKLAIATARGRSYWETGKLNECKRIWKHALQIQNKMLLFIGCFDLAYLHDLGYLLQCVFDLIVSTGLTTHTSLFLWGHGIVLDSILRR